jgi:transposase
VVAIETSCDLWLTVAHHFYGAGYQVLKVSPLTTKQSRVVVDNDYTQTDPKDAYLVAENARNGSYDIFELLGDDIEGAHYLSITYDKLRKDRARTKNRLNAFMRRVFPEYLNLVRVDTKTSLELLQRYFLPQHFLRLDLEAETKAILKVSRGQCGRDKLVQLQDAARSSIGVPLSGQELVYRLALDAWLDELHTLDRQRRRVDRQLIALAGTDPAFAILISMPGVSQNLAARFVAETRGPGRFTHYKQLQKLAGLNLRLTDSCGPQGPRCLSRIGNRRLRSVIYQMLEGTVKRVPQVRRRFLTRQLKKANYRKNLLAATPQLLRLILALIKENRVYDPRTELDTALKPLEQQYQAKNKRREHARRAA